jgi:hypothetical protein
MRLSPLNRPLWAVLCALLGALPAHAQGAPAAGADAQWLRVQVSDAASGGAVTDAEVWLGRTRMSTDSAGRVLLPRQHGRETLVVRRLGYTPLRRPVSEEESELKVVLVPEPVRISAVAANARPMPHSPPLRRFYERLESGRGRYLTREQIEGRHPRRITDLFREIPGVRIENTPRGERLRMDGATPAMYRLNTRWEAGDCPVQYYLDGVSYLPDFAGVPNDVRPDEVEGIEVYRRLPEVPVEYRRPGAECGVVLIWLKEHA